MRAFFRRNYDFFATASSCLPPLAEIDRAGEGVSIISARNGEPTVAYTIGDREILLHSSYNPGLEGQRLADDFDLGEADLLVLLGCGLGYHLEKFLPRLSPETTILIVEQDPGLFARFLDRCDWARLLSPFDCVAIVAADPMRLPARLRNIPFLNRPLKPALWEHGPSRDLFPEDYVVAGRTILEFLRDSVRNIRTLIAHAPIFFENVVNNLDLVSKYAGTADLFGRYRKCPVCVVSAGPSLDGNGHLLRRVADRAIIIAVDTAMKPLLRIGVEPHIVVAADPLPANIVHLRDLPSSRTVLVGELSLQRAIFLTYPGDIRLYSFDEAPQRFFLEFFGNKGILSAWGSVSTCALDLALRLGGDPIIFVGQDLSYACHHPYCRGTAYEEKFLEDMIHYGSPDAYWWACTRAWAPIEVLDIFGQPSHSSRALQGFAAHFRQQMQMRPDVRFVNATEGGILGEPAMPMSLATALRQFLSDTIDVSKIRPATPLHDATSFSQTMSSAAARVTSSAGFIESVLSRLPAKSDLTMEPALKELENADRMLKSDARVYDLYALLERQAVWSFERRMKRLQYAERGPGWADDVILGYSDFYRALLSRARWIMDLIEKRKHLPLPQ